jgi:hypothetical protein
MRYFIILLLLLAACRQADKLEEKEQTLDLSYIAWECSCPNWISREDLKKYGSNASTEALEEHCIYIEPADSSLALPDSPSVGPITVIRFTGHFHEEKGVPGDFGYEEHAKKARILRYTRYEIIRRDPDKEYSLTDTLVITQKAAVLYGPDSATIEKRMSDENFRIGMDDAAGGMQEANEYLESVKLPVLDTENKHYIKFVNSNGTSHMIKIDTLPDLAGIYLFDPAKPPRLIDMFSIEKEYADYYKK